MSFVLLGILNSQAAGGGNRYFVGDLNAEYSIDGIDVDSEGNIVLAMTYEGYDWGSIKLDAEGQIVLQNVLGDPIGGRNFLVAYGNLDANDDAYASGYMGNPGHLLAAKRNSSGVLQWQKALDVGLSSGKEINSSITRSNGDMVMVGQLETSFETFKPLYWKVDSNGNIQYQKVLNFNSSDENTFTNVKSDNTGAYIVAGDQSNGSILMKIDSNGNSQWQRTVVTKSDNQSNALGIDSNNNSLYVASKPTGTELVAFKVNTNGSLLLQRAFNGAGLEARDVAVDSNDNFYIVGTTTSFSDRTLIIKLDSSLNIVWTRTAFGSLSQQGAYSIMIDDNDDLVIGTGRNRALVLKYPADGSITGNFGSYTISSNGLSTFAPNNTFTTVTHSVSNSSISFINSNLTDATSSETIYIEPIG